MTAHDDERWLLRALELAAQVDETDVAPNPRVGAVIVGADGAVLAEGAHRRYGGPHAEAEAFAAAERAGADVRGATMYVSLEPCSHHGKTPPCADALLAAGIGRVVTCREDPNPKVAGRGLQRLRDAGVEVVVVDGPLEERALALNEAFEMLHAHGRPLLVAKWAMSLDGKIATATGDSRWISSEAARARTHALRAACGAVIVGRATALADDPTLTVRHGVALPPGRAGRPPLRVVLDAQARLPLGSRLVATAAEGPVLVIAAEGAPESAIAALREAGVEVACVPAAPGGAGGVDPLAALRLLGARGVQQALLEGGGTVLSAFLDARLVDRVAAVVAPILLGGAGATAPIGDLWGAERVSEAPRLTAARADPLADGEVLITGTLRWPEPPRP